MQFAYEAMRNDGTTVAAQIQAESHHEAVDALRTKGLIILKLSALAQKEAAAATSGFALRTQRITIRDIILFSRQMTMLLEAGTPVVPALQAAEEQTTKPSMRALLGRLADRVEQGDSLSAAMEHEPDAFDPVFRSMVAAGEATAALSQVFSRLCDLAQQQQRVQKMVVGALLYPAILSVLLVGVVSVLVFFVVPRFEKLFNSLRSPLPATTQMLFHIANWAQEGWPVLLSALVASVATAIIMLRHPRTRVWGEELVLRLPYVGSLISRLIFARVLRVWAALLRCHVPLLETVQQSRETVTNAAFLRLLRRVEDTVSAGGRMAQALASTRMADPVIVSAIRTGEENGRLAEATEFVSQWLEEDNSKALQHTTRLAEPLLLAFMGLVVGFIAMGLFLPLFDLATAAR